MITVYCRLSGRRGYPLDTPTGSIGVARAQFRSSFSFWDQTFEVLELSPGSLPFFSKNRSLPKGRPVRSWSFCTFNSSAVDKRKKSSQLEIISRRGRTYDTCYSRHEKIAINMAGGKDLYTVPGTFVETFRPRNFALIVTLSYSNKQDATLRDIRKTTGRKNLMPRFVQYLCHEFYHKKGIPKKHENEALLHPPSF